MGVPRTTPDSISLEALGPAPPPRGECELVMNEQHFQRVVLEGMLRAQVSLDIATADFKAMLTPRPEDAASRREAKSIVDVMRRLAATGVEVRLLHAGIPSGAAIEALRQDLPERLTIRRCPRLHMKAIIIDCRAMYLGSANLTGAGLGAKGEHRRNFEAGLWTTGGDLIDGVLGHFNELWEGQLCAACQRRDVCPQPLEEPNLS